MEKVCNHLSPELMLRNPNRASKASEDRKLGRVTFWGQVEGEMAVVSPGASSEETSTPLFPKEIPISVK